MSRGWESKDVEFQQELAEERRRRTVTAAPSAEALALQHQREAIDLHRRRVLADLERAKHPRHREQLMQALAHLDAQTAALSQA